MTSDMKGLEAFDEWEIAVMKGMIRDGFENQRIVAYFNHPDRPLNLGRISDLKSGKRFPNIAPASKEVVNSYDSEWRSRNSIVKEISSSQNPVHPEILKVKIPINPLDSSKIGLNESEEIEFKATFNFQPGRRDRFLKAAAALANNSGGYLVFGIEDKSKTICGTDEAKWNKTDIARITEVFRSSFSKTVSITLSSMLVGKKFIGIWYVEEVKNKPVVCTVTRKDLEDGAIYYRYSGRSEKIKAPELLELLADRDGNSASRISEIVQKIENTGIENAAILDLQSGTVEGQQGHFVIDRPLLEEIQFIKEGEFNEKDGASTLKLIGSVKANTSQEVLVREELSDNGLLEDFILQKKVPNPTHYIHHLCHTQRKWLPIYFFARLAGLNKQKLIRELQNVRVTKSTFKNNQIERVQKGVAHTFSKQSFKGVSEETANVLNGKYPDMQNEEALKAHLKAVAIMTREQANSPRPLAFLAEVYEFGLQKIKNDHVRNLFYAAACQLDFLQNPIDRRD